MARSRNDGLDRWIGTVFLLIFVGLGLWFVAGKIWFHSAGTSGADAFPFAEPAAGQTIVLIRD
jgi:hypothetical protein